MKCMRFHYIENINFVQQECNQSCVGASLAMVTNNSLDYVTDFIDSYLTRDEDETKYPMHTSDWIHFLIKHGLYPQTADGLPFTPFYPGSLYLVTAPSLNQRGGSHMMVLQCKPDGEQLIHDPNRGRKNKDYYASDSFENLNWLEVILLCDIFYNKPVMSH